MFRKLFPSLFVTSLHGTRFLGPYVLSPEDRRSSSVSLLPLSTYSSDTVVSHQSRRRFPSGP